MLFVKRCYKNYLLNASLSSTMLLCLSILNIFTSLIIVFLAISSSSDSLNFFIATIRK